MSSLFVLSEGAGSNSTVPLGTPSQESLGVPPSECLTLIMIKLQCQLNGM